MCLTIVIAVIVVGWIVIGISNYRDHKRYPRHPKYNPWAKSKLPMPELNPICIQHDRGGGLLYAQEGSPTQWY
jgi:hypothetical protein